MPLLKSEYQPPKYLYNGHLGTIIPSVFRKIPEVYYNRERIFTPDDDFIDLDWTGKDSSRLILLAHGLEGGADRSYMKGMARYFDKHGWDVLAWNCRSCSGEMNRLPRFYHHADSADLAFVIRHAASQGYREILLAGFSMGGNLILKYFGESPEEVHPAICGAGVWSVPVSLQSSVKQLSRYGNGVYRRRFLKKLRRKIEEKSKLFPGQIDASAFKGIKYFPDFDNRYTAPLHGFRDADHFYESASAAQYIPAIQRPVLLVNALNDPFLGEECYPYELCRTHESVYLETPAFGGHVGFSLAGRRENYMEIRTHWFYSTIIAGHPDNEENSSVTR